MHKSLFAATAALALMAAMPAAAGEWYAQVNAGATVATDADVTATFTPDDDTYDPSSGSISGDLDEGFAVGAAAGYAVGNGLRLEGEFLYSSNDLGSIEELDVDSIEFNHAAFFANVLYDIPMQGGFSPYIGAGIGYGSSTFDIDSDEVHDEGTAWQIKAGVTYPVNDSLTLDLGYRYMDMADWNAAIDGVDLPDDSPDAGPGTAAIEFEPTAHILTVGARFKLGNAPA